MRTVLIVLFDGVQSLDVAGPLEVFAGANRWQSGRDDSPAGPAGPDGPAYRIRAASLAGGPVRTTSGLRLAPDQALSDLVPDVLLVPGGAGTRHADPDLVAWLRGHGPPVRLRHARGHAARLHPRPRRQPGRVPPPVPPRPLLRRIMQIAIVLYDRFTALDAVGPYQVLTGLPGAEVVFAAEQPGPVTDDEGRLCLTAEVALADVPHPEVVLVPGGPGQNDQMHDGPLHRWLRAADQSTAWTTSVCTGSLILAAAGLLNGRRATSYWMALGQLERYGVTPVAERVVFDDKYVTAAGVSSGIDMALALAGRVAGDRTAQTIQLGIEYDPQPPYHAGSPATAPAEIVNYLESRSRFILT